MAFLCFFPHPHLHFHFPPSCYILTTTSFSCTSFREKNLKEVQEKLPVSKKRAMGLLRDMSLAIPCYMWACYALLSPLIISLFLTLIPLFTLTSLSHCLVTHYCSTGGLTILLTLASLLHLLAILYMGMLWFTLSPNFPLYHPHTTSSHPHFPFSPPCFTILCNAILCFTLCHLPLPPPQPDFSFPPPCCTIAYMDMLCYSPGIEALFQSSINHWHGSLVKCLPATQMACDRFPLEHK